MEPTSIRVLGGTEPGGTELSLRVLEWSRDGVPMLFVHGFGNEAHVWDDIIPAFAPHYRCLALDLRGHGESDRDPQARYDYDALVTDLEAVCDALELSRLVLVGHSLGGRAAMLFAGRHPERLAGLVIADSAPELDPRGTLRIVLDHRRAGEEQTVPSFGSVEEYRALLERQYPAARPEALRRLAQHGLRRRDDGHFEPRLDPAWLRPRPHAGAAASDLEGGRSRDTDEGAQEEGIAPVLWAALRRVSCPTLVVRGAASDVVAADVADRMVEEALSDGRLAVVPRAGHSVMVDNPEGFREALAAFALGEA